MFVFSINDVLVDNNTSLDMITSATDPADLLFDVTQFKAVKEVIEFSRENMQIKAMANDCHNQYQNSTDPANLLFDASNRKAMNRNWSNQKANPALKT